MPTALGGFIIGIHEIDTSYKMRAGISTKVYNPKLWKKISIEKGSTFHVLLPNDSISNYSLEADTLNKTLNITSPDSSFNCKLHYVNIDPDHWFFEGTSSQDSIRFITRQIDIYKLPLLKDYGKIIWSWMSAPL